MIESNQNELSKRAQESEMKETINKFGEQKKLQNRVPPIPQTEGGAKTRTQTRGQKKDSPAFLYDKNIVHWCTSLGAITHEGPFIKGLIDEQGKKGRNKESCNGQKSNTSSSY